MALLTLESLNLFSLDNLDIDSNELVTSKLLNTPSFEIGSSDLLFCTNLIKKIRQSKNKNIYLKPIFIIENSASSVVNEYLRDSVDGVLDMNQSLDQKMKIEEQVNYINNRILTLKDVDSDEDVAFKALRMIYTRNLHVVAKMNIDTILGYSYPILDMLFDDSTENSIFDILSILQSKGLLEGLFLDKTHSCRNCKSTFLNFKEVCTDCGSVNITKNTIIHHFGCGNMSYESEYKDGDNLVCPKCDKLLHHIGVDYDKPSFMFKCNSCNHDFPEANVVATCFNCKSTSDVENLKTLIIYNYQLTALAKSAAVFGFQNLFSNILEENLDILPLVFFEKNIKFEINRISRYKKSVSTFALLNISGMENVHTKTISEEKLFLELSDIIRGFLRTTDMITMITDSTFAFLLTETESSGADRALERMKQDIELLFKENIKEELSVKLYREELNEDSKFEDIKSKIVNHEFS